MTVPPVVNQAATLSETAAAAVLDALRDAMADGALPRIGEVPEVTVERPKDPGHGDLSTNIAMRLAALLKLPPRDVAETLRQHLVADGMIASAEVAGPGFLNLRLDPGWLVSQLSRITGAAGRWGEVDDGAGMSAQVEFVSANPTGPITLGGTRGAALGDAVCNVLQAAGYRVEREFYVNDAGSRMQTFYLSCAWFYRRLCGVVDAPAPAEPYPAAERAASLLFAEHGAALRGQDDEAVGVHGIAAQLAEMRADLERLGVHFDSWFHEQSLFDMGKVEATLERLRQAGCVAEREGAVWFTASSLGLEKDEVLIRSSGMPTYLMSDIAYHLDKLETRGFSRAIDVWGADHQGHIARLHAALRALAVEDTRLTVVVTQLVTVAGARMKKAHGNYVTLSEILEAVSPDAIRFFLISRNADSAIDFDLDLAVKAGNENPVFYVQMAHARCAGVFRQAAQEGVSLDNPELARLGADESPLIQLMLSLPEVVRGVARDLEPHRLSFYAQELAAAWHRYYHDHRIVDAADPLLSGARLHLTAAVQIVLARTLRLMGMSAPERM